MLQDWRCAGNNRGEPCTQVLLAFDPTRHRLEDLKASQQVKCKRCGHLNGVKGRRADDRRIDQYRAASWRS